MKKNSVQLLIATNNIGKLKEIKRILSELDIDLLDYRKTNLKYDPIETGNSYFENALLKAKYASQMTGLISLAEDSGLEIDILDGKPGIRSARYVQGSDNDRIIHVLKKLKGVPNEKRTARFRTVAVLYDPQKEKAYSFEGASEGYITQKPTGKNGFGYDPIFFNRDLGKTNAQATMKEKNTVSHRYRAVRQAGMFLKSLLY